MFKYLYILVFSTNLCNLYIIYNFIYFRIFVFYIKLRIGVQRKVFYFGFGVTAYALYDLFLDISKQHI